MTADCGLAAFVYSGPQSADPFGGPPAAIDIDADLQIDLSFLFGVFESPSIVLAQFIVDVETGNSVLFEGGVPALMIAGESIRETPTAPREWLGNTVSSGSSITQWNYLSGTGTWSGWSPPVPAGNTGYMGVQVQTVSGTRLGWVEIEFLGTGVNSAPLITGWGYETDPVTALIAGVIPEPASLFLLGLGLVAVVARSPARRLFVH